MRDSLRVCLDKTCFKVKISLHARNRMGERGISVEDLVESITDPVQYLYDTWNDVYLSITRKGDAIVYAFRGDTIEVVTVLSKREYNALVKKYGTKRYKLIS